MSQSRAPVPGAGPLLRRVSDYAWRLLAVGAAVYVGYLLALRFEAVLIALFLACVFTALLRPPANVLARVLPRPLAVATAALGWLCLLAGVFSLTAARVASEAPNLGSEFRGGVQRVETWLEGPPFRVHPAALANAQNKVTAYLEAHRGTLLSQALSDVSKGAEVLTILALSIFCSVYFTHSGERMWTWFQGQLPARVRPTWRRCGQAAWRTFAGYTRGVILIAAANATMVGIALAILRVPLVLPLVLLEFFLSFVPLAGSPIALAVATLVALASQGVTTAIVVLVLIVVLGQIEGHVLQPLVMGWSVRLHPVAVAVSVIGGTIAAGPLGAVLAVPFVSIAWAVYGELRSGSPQDEDRNRDQGTTATGTGECESSPSMT
ncbi:MAG TPA: AI-2E family transporter [Actinospica sp.]|nr:AI-2E family transporter [Actinospica sp.]